MLSFCDMEITNQNLETINPSFHQYIKKEKRCEKYNNFDLTYINLFLLVDKEIQNSLKILYSFYYKKPLFFYLFAHIVLIS